jgi:DNA-binding transcriptional MerR regulator
MAPNELLTIAEFAELAGVSRQSIYKQMSTRLSKYCKLIDNRKMIEYRALSEVFGVSVEQPSQPKNDNSVNLDVNPSEPFEEIIEMLRNELEVKNRQITTLQEQNIQLTETIAKMSDSLQAAQALHAGTIQQQLEGPVEPQSAASEPMKSGFWGRLFKR